MICTRAADIYARVEYKASMVHKRSGAAALCQNLRRIYHTS